MSATLGGMTQSEVPIIPGDPPTPVHPEVAPVKPKPKTPAWAVYAVALAIAAIAAAVWALAANDALAVTKKTALQEAYEACGFSGELSDGGRTLFLDMGGKSAWSGMITQHTVACILRSLAAPTYVTREMGSTRALDGRQRSTWGDFEASWTYHPDNGLDILIREISG